MQKIRKVTQSDVSKILKIYEYYIQKTIITFEYEVPSLDDFTKRIESISSKYPYLICEIDDEIVGFAYASRHMQRTAYQWNAELSIYLDHSFCKRGIGKQLYIELIEMLKKQQIRNIYGCISLPNEQSVKFHEHFGFTPVGIYKNAGYKFGKWHDVIWYEKHILQHTLEPKPFIPIQSLK